MSNWTALEVMWKEVKGRDSYASMRTSFHPNRWAGRALPTFRGRRKIRRTKIIEKGSIMSQNPNKYQLGNTYK